MKSAAIRSLCWGGMLLAGLVFGTPARAADEKLAEARHLFFTGKYAEAEELFPKAEDPVAAALGMARCRRAVGELDKAAAGLVEAAKDHEDAAALVAEQANIAFARGDYKAVNELVEQALKLDADQLLAHWLRAELDRCAGKLDEANRGYKWFVDYYNAHDDLDPESLHLVGLAAAQFARWNRLSDQFSFLVNDLYPEILKQEKSYWPAHLEMGLLFLEKYNQRDASRELKAALAINQSAALAHAAIAQLALQGFELSEAQSSLERALEINPKLLVASQLQADIHLANIEPQKALEVLKGALLLHPTHEETLGRVVAAMAALDGLPTAEAPGRAGKLIDEVNARNPHAGDFYMTLADSMDRLRRFPSAAEYYEQATERMPQLTVARGQWGMMLMRLGDEDRAKKLLDESFKIDPFNVRISNTLKVLEVLAGYETLETEHFRIKFDPAKDKVLARYAGKWLEEVYPQLCKQLNYEPPDRSLFEIFNKAKNTDGHGWFSARMVGLPHVHTIGACAGKMVAMQSPTDGQKFNWARVLKHEFVHVVNLQQTNFNIPHWYTEALATLNEGYPRSQAWNELLVARVAEGKIFNLDTINLGFIRPHSSQDWTLAYCQAELYAEYMLEKFGADALAKMLSAYGDNLGTRDAIRRSFSVDQAEFEKGYREHLDKIVAGLSIAKPAAEKQQTFGQLQKALDADPKNPDLMASVAQAHLNRKAYPEARKLADAALAAKPKHSLASYVRARLHMLIGENDAALKLLEEGLDEAAPQENLLSLLAGLRLKAEAYEDAARLYELGAKHEPQNIRWVKSLAVVYLKSGQNKQLVPVLKRLAGDEADDITVRKKLAELASKEKDWAAAEDWARQAMQIDVQDAELHRLLGQARAGREQYAAAAEEYETAIELKPDDAQSHFALADAYLQAKQPDKARAALKALLKLDPQFPGADVLLESLEK